MQLSSVGAGGGLQMLQPPATDPPHGSGWAHETAWLAAAFSIFAAEDAAIRRMDAETRG